MDLGLTGKWALVCGASKGLGWGCARALALDGVYGTIDIRMDTGRPVLTAPEPIPDWISVSQNRINVTTEAGRFSVSRNRTEVFRYFPGWELFFFTLDSPFYGKGAGELLALATTGDRIDPARSNLGYMASEFWTNKMWRHGDVMWAIFETILMAFLGTMTAAIVALPLSFLAARNFMPLGIFRGAVRRVFDFIRGTLPPRLA